MRNQVFRMCALFYCLPPLSLLSVRGSEEEGIPDVCTLAGPSPSSFSCTPAPLPRSLSLAIVEEHHEVLPYWEACLKRVHPSRDGDGEGDGKDTKPVFQKRNTLLHVDVHSDLSLPVSGVPVEPWLDGITPAMMQKPDLHVLAAAYAGVYDRVVWLHPWWTSHKPDKKPSLSRPSMSEHLMQYHFIGYGTKDLVEQILDSNGYRGLSPETVFCGCSTDMVVVRGDGKNRVSVSQLPVGVSDSIWQNFTACNVRLPAVHHGGGVEDVEDLSFLEPHWCNFSRVVRVESLSLETAESVSERNRQKQKCGDPEEGKTCPPVLFSPDEKVILSIDEAFMGVRAGGRGVREWGLHLEAQKQLDETVSAVFCPTTPDAEREMDGFLKSLVKSVRDACGTAVNGDCHLDLQWTRSFLSLPKRRASLLQRMCGDARGRMQRAAENQRKRMEEKKKQQQGEEVEVPPPPQNPMPSQQSTEDFESRNDVVVFPHGGVVDSLPVELTEGTPGALERKEMLRVLLAGVHRLVTLLARIYRLREREVGEMGGHSVLSSVARTGFCLSTSPRSSFKPSRLQLCARGGGADDWYAPHDPDGAREGGLIEHTPIGVTEVEETARRLEKVLKAELPNPPPCLSVTRSTRDGHTPIESWREYETALIGVVDSLFRKLERETPTRVYDKWLLHPGPAIVSSTEGSAQTDRADLEKILTAAGGESPGGSLAGNQNFFASQPGASPQSLPLSPFVPSRVSTFAEMSLRSL